MAAAHGGQIFLSLATEELVRDHLPADIALREMGERGLKDFIRPERAYQVISPDLSPTSLRSRPAIRAPTICRRGQRRSSVESTRFMPSKTDCPMSMYAY